MSRTQVAVVAFRVVAMWLIATAVGEAAAMVPVWAQFGGQRLLLITAAMAVLAPLAAGALVWKGAPTIASWIFRDRQTGPAPSTPDLYRVASAFTGLLLLGQSLPAIALLPGAWLFSMTAHTSVLGSGGLSAGERDAVIDVMLKGGIVAGIVKVLIGAVLVATPDTVERAIRHLRRESSADEPEVEMDSQSQDDAGTH